MGKTKAWSVNRNIELFFLFTESQLAGELARFVVDLTASRQRAFAKLTVQDVFPEAS